MEQKYAYIRVEYYVEHD